MLLSAGRARHSGEDGRPWQIVYTSSSLGSIQSAVLAGLGITICGRSSVLAGMKIVNCEQGIPKLPKTSIAIYSRQSAVAPLAKHLTAFIIKALIAGKAIAPYGRPLYRLRFLPLILQSSKMEMAHINCRSARSTANEALRRSRQAVPDERS
jgi:hypothetical protein